MRPEGQEAHGGHGRLLILNVPAGPLDQGARALLHSRLHRCPRAHSGSLAGRLGGGGPQALTRQRLTASFR